MRFLVDANLPPSLALLIVSLGYEAEHVADQGMQSSKDQSIWTYAIQTSAIIITRDEDFARRRSVSRTGPSIVWLRTPNLRRRDLLAWFQRAFPSIATLLQRGETLVEAV